MAINANSSHKEGAWEFIAMLIGEESQSTGMDILSQPVHKKVFEDWLQVKLIYELATKHKRNGADYIPAYYGEDTSEGKLAEYRQTLQEASPCGPGPSLQSSWKRRGIISMAARAWMRWLK